MIAAAVVQHQRGSLLYVRRLEHGGEGLFEWKLPLQFHPGLVDMSADCVNILPSGIDEAAYLDLNPDVRRAKLDARMHYLVWGKSEGRRYR